MEFDEWDEKFNAVLEEEVDKYLYENEEALFADNPMKSKEQQLQQSREEILKSFRLDDASDQIETGIKLIKQFLPRRISESEWETVYNEFINCDQSLTTYFNACEDGERDKDEFVPIHEMCGISDTTLSHAYTLGCWMFDEKDFADARAIFSFLLTIAPHYPEFWISAGMCHHQMEEYAAAIELYQLACELFPKDAAMFIHCANNYLEVGDMTHAKIELEKAYVLFYEFPESKSEWSKTYDYLKSRLR